MLGFCLALIDEPSDKEKFMAIYNKYKDAMFYKAMSITHNETLSEDVVQESFFKIAKNITSVSDPNSTKTLSFILIIVRNTALNMIHSEHLKENAELTDDIPDISSDILSDLISEEGYSRLLKAVTELDDIYSDAMILCLVYGYSTEQTSKLLNISERTVESRLYRGRKLLYKKLEEDYGEYTVGK